MREWREGGDPEQSHQDEDPWQNRWREESGAQPTEVEVGEVETPAEPRRQRPRMTPLDWRAKAEPLVHGIWVNPVGGCSGRLGRTGSDEGDLGLSRTKSDKRDFGLGKSSGNKGGNGGGKAWEQEVTRESNSPTVGKSRRTDGKPLGAIWLH